jgi:Domain of unknown function (DUF4136)
MRKLIFLLSTLLLVILLFISCEPSLKVTHDYDKSASFGQYKTFSIVQLDQQHQSISQFNQDRIINAVKTEMIKKGFQESSSPDLLVEIVTVLKNKQSVTANTNYYGYGGFYRPYGWGGGMATGYTTYNVQNYKDGSLIIDIVDAGAKKLVWEGIGNKEIDHPSDNPEKDIATAVTAIMASFPPGAVQPK